MLILLFIGALFVSVVTVSVLARAILDLKFNSKKLLNKYENSKDRNNPLLKKYKEAEVNHYSGSIIRSGLVLVLLALIVAFNWNQNDAFVAQVIEDDFIYEDFEIQPDPSVHRKEKKEKVPEIVESEPVVEIVEDEKIIEEEVIVEEEEVDVEETVETVDLVAAVEVMEAETDEEEIVEMDPFLIVQFMPEYPGGDKALLKEIANRLRFPRIAMENGISGKVYIRFVVNEDGSVSEAEIVKDIGGGCGQAALEIVNNLKHKFKPGRQRDKPVKVYYTLPVKFALG